MNASCRNDPLIGIVENPTKPGAVQLRALLMQKLGARKLPCRFFADAAGVAACGEAIRCLIVIGGDGSILRFADVASARDIPLLGVNVGRIGFLAELTAADLDRALARLQSGDYTVEQRMMLRCSINDDAPFHCLNDILVFKRSFSGVAQITVTVDNECAGTVFCDGMIAATPTGSTGYSLSAGGPVIAPGMEAIALTPVCSHTLYMRPIVTSADAVIRFSVEDGGVVAADGMRRREVGTGDCISVTRSERRARFIRVNETGLFGLIREKLS